MPESGLEQYGTRPFHVACIQACRGIPAQTQHNLQTQRHNLQAKGCNPSHLQHKHIPSIEPRAGTPHITTACTLCNAHAQQTMAASCSEWKSCRQPCSSTLHTHSRAALHASTHTLCLLNPQRNNCVNTHANQVPTHTRAYIRVSQHDRRPAA